MKDKRRIRASVILELINSERDYVKHLGDVVEGYLYPARRHPEIFTGERINIIFSNIEQLYEFQKKFLSKLESCIDWQDPASSLVGQCFLEYEQGFSIYHHYCNNHPNASCELLNLFQQPKFIKFFEACRLLQNMIDISLDGFLLTPIQRICKYPLQLNELLKNTDEDHQDFQSVSNALETMRNCANLANERKRRMEALADIISFQERIDNWSGPKLSETSSILIHSGEVTKITPPSHKSAWNSINVGHQNVVQLFLFDHLLLLCKRDTNLLKRNQLIFKRRINMDTITEISDADEYKSNRSFKLYCNEEKKWFIFATKCENDKDEWIRAFERERNLVESDEMEDFRITDKEINVAKRALQNRKHSRSARYRQQNRRPDTAIDQLDLDDAGSIINRTQSLPSCIHPLHVGNFVKESRVLNNNTNNSNNNNANTTSPTTRASGSSSHNKNSFNNGSSNQLNPNIQKQLLNSNGNNNNDNNNFNFNNNTPKSPSQQLQSNIPWNITNNNSSQLQLLMGISNSSNQHHLINKNRTSSHFPTTDEIESYRPVASGQVPNSHQQQHLEHSLKFQDNKNPRDSSLPRKYYQQTTKVDEHEIETADVDNYNQERKDSTTTVTSLGDTFETTLVLSSGRVVRVREDTV